MGFQYPYVNYQLLVLLVLLLAQYFIQLRQKNQFLPSMKKKILLALNIFVALACGWDWDTIQMEKQQFPQIHELITGKFYRHSQELYYWRIKDRTVRIQKYPDSLHLYDDLAMAYDKTGESKKAIEIMLKKEKRKPGLYETYANLGLFYMHANDMKNGVDYVKKALKVNPNAHFGREKYQLYLGEYILEKFPDGNITLPLSKGKTTGFYHYLLKHEFKNKDYKSEAHFKELSDAIKGVSGMMTFANYRSPVLLETLADLLLHTNSHRGAGHLASRAYLKASLETEGEISKAYYEKAKWAREQNYASLNIIPEEYMERMKQEHHDKVDSITGKLSEVPVYRMEQLEIALKIEVQLAEQWFDSIRNDEIEWIKSGKNPDNEFAKKYYGNKNLKNKALSEYDANAAKNKVDNKTWLKLQLTRPADIRNIHGYNQLSDSVKKVLDEIYEAEFADTVIIENQSPVKSNSETSKTREIKKDNSLLYLVIAASILLIGVLGLRWMLRKKH